MNANTSPSANTADAVYEYLFNSVRFAKNKAVNDVSTRRMHPTYVTKTMVRATIAEYWVKRNVLTGAIGNVEGTVDKATDGEGRKLRDLLNEWDREVSNATSELKGL